VSAADESRGAEGRSPLKSKINIFRRGRTAPSLGLEIRGAENPVNIALPIPGREKKGNPMPREPNKTKDRPLWGECKQ